MNSQDAKRAMERGKKVRLPEWRGLRYMCLILNRITIVRETAAGDSDYWERNIHLNYFGRTDWEIVPEEKKPHILKGMKIHIRFESEDADLNAIFGKEKSPEELLDEVCGLINKMENAPVANISDDVALNKMTNADYRDQLYNFVKKHRKK